MHQLGVPFRSTSHQVKYRLFLSRNRLKLELEGSNSFQVLHPTKVECLLTSNVINNKVANLLHSSPTGGITYYLQKTLIEGEGVISHIGLLQQVQFDSFYIYMTSRLQNPRKPLQGSFVDMWMYKSGGERCLFFSKYRIKRVKLKDCQIKQGGSKTLQIKHSEKLRCLAKFSKY